VVREPFKNTVLGIVCIGVISSLIASYIWSNRSQYFPGPTPVYTPSPIKKNFGFLAGTRWRGRVGRAPASLDISRTESGYWTAKVRYTGIVEDFAMTINDNGAIAMTGKAYRREIGNGAFALDRFSGQVSSDGEQLWGTLIDGKGLGGRWSVTKVENSSQVLKSTTTNLLFPNGASTSHWEGIIGKSDVSLDILQNSSGRWVAKAAYHGVIEELTVSVEDDGTVVLNGQSYEAQSADVLFSLSTFYGEVSSDGNHLQGLRIDASGNRDSWRLVRSKPVVNHRLLRTKVL